MRDARELAKVSQDFSFAERLMISPQVANLPTMRSQSSGHRGLFQTQFLHYFCQVLVIDLEDNLKAIIRSGKDI